MARKFFAFLCIALLISIDASVQSRKLEDKIVFVSERQGTPEVFLVEGLDGRPFQLTQDLFTSSPSISPDGTEVVFVSTPPAQTANILKLNIAKRRIERLTHNAKQDIRYEHLNWSPDGREILFIMTTPTPKGSTTDLCVMDTEGRQIRHILQPDPTTRILNPSWAPDSNHIIYRQDFRIFIIDDNGNNVVNVPQDRLKHGFLPAWSPKRTQIGYIEIVTTSQPPPNPLQIYMMNLAAANVIPLTSGGDEERIPLAWHPDGQKILFVMLTPVEKGTQWSDIFVMDNNGENIINLTQTPEEEAHASWSPNGEKIVFDRLLKKGEAIGDFEAAIFVMEADGQNPQRLTFEPGINFAPSWSPDGNRIAFLSDRNGALRIYTMDTNGQNVQQITHHGREFDGPPAWSPDGKWLAFVSADEQSWGLYVTDPHGQNEEILVRSNPIRSLYLAWNRPAWSPDSQHLIYATEVQHFTSLIKIRIDGDMLTQLKTDELVGWLSPVWSSGGMNLLFSAREAREPIVLEAEYKMLLMNLNTEEKHEFVLPGIFEKDWSFHRLVWGPDGSQLILSVEEEDQQNSLYLIDIPNETITLWMEDAKEADWVRPGFVYAVEAAKKRITTWGELKKPEKP